VRGGVKCANGSLVSLNGLLGTRERPEPQASASSCIESLKEKAHQHQQRPGGAEEG
jgi:hypothetical protein